MNRKIFLIILLLPGIILFNHCTRKDNVPVLKGPYLGQKPPGMTPELLAPGIVSTGYLEQFAYFTPDAKELYFLLREAPHTVVLCMKEVNGRWTKPEVAPFSGKYFAKFCISPDGNRIVLTSTQPRKGYGEPTDVLTTWFVDRIENGWGEPELVEHLYDAAAPSIANNGNLYFYIDIGDERDIYISEYFNGYYLQPVKLSSAINSDFHEVDPFIAPDESYLIYGANGPDEDGLYISFKDTDDTWTKAVNMSKRTEIPMDANCASVSFDGKYLFFTSFKSHFRNYSEIPLTYEEKIKILNSPGNGKGDIYWVDARIIDEMKPGESK